MNIGEAVQAMKANECVRRAGWNGRGMHIYREERRKVRIGNMTRQYEPVYCMFTAQGTHQEGWVASQADLDAEDWEIVPR